MPLWTKLDSMKPNLLVVASLLALSQIALPQQAADKTDATNTGAQQQHRQPIPA